eukprot:48638-Chlamydomonas_euryale.AAC.1
MARPLLGPSHAPTAAPLQPLPSAAVVPAALHAPAAQPQPPPLQAAASIAGMPHMAAAQPDQTPWSASPEVWECVGVGRKAA